MLGTTYLLWVIVLRPQWYYKRGWLRSLFPGLWDWAYACSRTCPAAHVRTVAPFVHRIIGDAITSRPWRRQGRRNSTPEFLRFSRVRRQTDIRELKDVYVHSPASRLRGPDVVRIRVALEDVSDAQAWVAGNCNVGVDLGYRCLGSVNFEEWKHSFSVLRYLLFERLVRALSLFRQVEF